MYLGNAREVIRQRDAIRSDIGPDGREGSARGGEELRGAVLPEHDELERIPGLLAVDN